MHDRDKVLLAELTPVAEALLERHLAQAKEWFPHEIVPWTRGRDFDPGVAWTEDDSAVELPPEVRSALFVNLLTEDNLPYYFRTIERIFGRDGVWGEWNRRWTAEEGRHAIAIRDYLTRHPRHRPGGPRAGPHGPGPVRPGARAASRPATPSPTSPCRSSPPGSPTTTPAS